MHAPIRPTRTTSTRPVAMPPMPPDWRLAVLPAYPCTRPESDTEWMAITMPNLAFHVGTSWLDPSPSLSKAPTAPVNVYSRGLVLTW